jgi:micrococcal nuclease
MGCFTSKVEEVGETERDTQLLSMTLKDVKQFSFKGLVVKAKVVDIYDGDTFRAVFWYKDAIIQTSCRCLEYDAPEMKISRLTPESDREILKKMAYNARDRLKELLGTGLIELRFSENDMYGRPLTKIFVNGKYINQIMIDEGHGKPYNGGHKNEWTVKDSK